MPSGLVLVGRRSGVAGKCSTQYPPEFPRPQLALLPLPASAWVQEQAEVGCWGPLQEGVRLGETPWLGLALAL